LQDTSLFVRLVRYVTKPLVGCGNGH